MALINAKVTVASNVPPIDIGLPENILLRDVIGQLIDANHLKSGNTYLAVLESNGSHPEHRQLNMDKTVSENGIIDEDIICIEVGPEDAEEKIEKIYLGINSKSIPPVDVSKLIAQNDALPILLHELVRSKEENEQWEQKQKDDYLALCKECANLQNELQSYKIKLSERRTATIALTAAQIIIGLGSTFLIENVIPSVVTIFAGITLTIWGLWLSFKKAK